MSKQFVRLLTVTFLALAAGLAMLAGIAYALAPSNTDLVGTWNNIDSSSNSIVQIVIADDGAGGITVAGFGVCAPTLCEWGTVAGAAYSDSVIDGRGKYFTAIYDFHFKTTILTGELNDDGTLVVHSYNQFTDGSSRFDYHSKDVFSK